jgi:acyl-CoA reductase-like NAD-dependent aldehyde dehydrogenase
MLDGQIRSMDVLVCNTITRIYILLANMGEEYHNFTVREPIGVCGLIVAWNFPRTFLTFSNF